MLETLVHNVHRAGLDALLWDGAVSGVAVLIPTRQLVKHDVFANPGRTNPGSTLPHHVHQES